MNGNDLRPPINRLPSINEQPAIEQSETNGTEEPAAISSVHSATDDDDPFPLSTPLPMRETQTIATPKVVPPTPETQPTPRPLPVSRPSAPTRQQSLLPDRQTTLIQALLRASQAEENGLLAAEQLLPIHNSMVTRKIWVRRPGSSATQVTINEEDLVDDVRDMILRKYGNSLGRQFDSPDLTLRIVPREKRQERTLGPEEPMGRTLDAYFPGGQTVDEALVIDVPLVRRTPRASPRTGPPHATHLTSVSYYDEVRPTDSSTDYFGPNVVASGGHLPMTVTAPSTGSSHPHSMSVLSTGQVPQIPSPGGTRSRNYRDRPDRPRLGRQHTSSPTIIGGHPVSMTAATVKHGTHSRSSNVPRSRTHSNASSDQNSGAPAPPAPPMPTPPAGDMPNPVPSMVPIQRASTPPPRTASPRPLVSHMAAEGSSVGGGKPSKPKKKKTTDERPPALPASIMNNGVPPINVLIVEDNIINLKLLEAFVKRLKVRWSTAMNGRDAVTKWRTGGFHLVLMDIQLPIMSGLDATREIRRLERVNSVGVFSGTSAGSAFALDGGNFAEKVEPDPEDKLVDIFKSPVIIVALTASSLQSDRHEALAAGCNDFLTKPVNFIWLERKVMEWGCMQALIDFDGWRKWKDFSGLNKGADDAASEASKKAGGAAAKSKKAKNRTSMSSTSSSAQVGA
ncbi:response regulator receiver domain-containing protein [Coniochaeta sp. 2T2.1]|nr:response regulator receiver domain-containing protein [Coniochaeta sp. 2T2.1]